MWLSVFIYLLIILMGIINAVLFLWFIPFACKSKDKDGNEIDAVDEAVWYASFGVLIFINIAILISFFIYTFGVVIKRGVAAAGTKYTEMKSNASAGFKSMKEGASTGFKSMKEGVNTKLKNLKTK